jgi:hypothetical protein
MKNIIVTFLVVAFALTEIVYAQRPGIVGTFFDAQGSVIRGMDLKVTDNRGKSVTSKSNEEGRFVVELAVGTYTLEIGSSNSLFCKVVIERYRVVNPREPMNLDILLAEGRSSHGGDDCRKKVIKF